MLVRPRFETLLIRENEGQLGRGDFAVRELADRYKTLKENAESAAALASQLTYKAPLADDLQDGIAELKRHNIDVDILPLEGGLAMSMIEETIEATLDSNGQLRLTISRGCRPAPCKLRSVSRRRVGAEARPG